MGAEPDQWTGLEPEHKVALKLKMHTKCSSKSNMSVILKKMCTRIGLFAFYVN